jgi:hypothetical protein
MTGSADDAVTGRRVQADQASAALRSRVQRPTE